ncbi:MAG: hypothetical protein FXF54_04155 [Kosmotoga sp.]|nr:MAG: hypothetical protein FXF54_04155 [Kosmotoga sp.]
MTFKIFVLLMFFALVSVNTFSMVEYLDLDLSDFPSVSILASLKGYYPINKCNFKENNRTVSCSITVLKESETQSVDLLFFVDTSLSMNNKVKTVQQALEELLALTKNIETNKIFHFYTLENYIDSITKTDFLETSSVVKSLFKSIDSPDEKPLEYLNNIIDKIDLPSIFTVFTDKDGIENIKIERIEEISKKLSLSGCYLFIVSNKNPKIEIDNIAFIDYSQIHKISSLISEIKDYLLKLSYTTTSINIPLRTISLYGNEKTYVAPTVGEPKIVLYKDFEQHGYAPGDTLQIKGSVKASYNGISVTQNNSPISFSFNANEFSFEVELAEGVNTINITATGNHGKHVLKRKFFAVNEKQSTLEIFLDWEAENADMDLYVKEPTGWVYFLNKENYGHLKEDVQSGIEDAEYYISKKVIPGSYEIYVHAYKIRQPMTGSVNILLDGTIISSKTFKFSKSSIENCFPGDSGDDWQLIGIFDL